MGRISELACLSVDPTCGARIQAVPSEVGHRGGVPRERHAGGLGLNRQSRKKDRAGSGGEPKQQTVVFTEMVFIDNLVSIASAVPAKPLSEKSVRHDVHPCPLPEAPTPVPNPVITVSASPTSIHEGGHGHLHDCGLHPSPGRSNNGRSPNGVEKLFTDNITI